MLEHGERNKTKCDNFCTKYRVGPRNVFGAHGNRDRRTKKTRVDRSQPCVTATAAAAVTEGHDGSRCNAIHEKAVRAQRKSGIIPTKRIPNCGVCPRVGGVVAGLPATLYHAGQHVRKSHQNTVLYEQNLGLEPYLCHQGLQVL